MGYIEEKLKQIILDKYKSVRAFSVETNIPYSTIDNIFKRGILNSGISTVMNICADLNIDVEALTENKIIPKQKRIQSTLSEDELNLIEQYNFLSDEGKITLTSIISSLIQYEKTVLETQPEPESKTIYFEEEKKKRELPYYTIAASAGTGNFLATDDYILIEVNEYVPQQANYALKVKGDSMEPKYHDGDIVYVKTQKSVENGEIGIFCINDNVYIKKLECEEDKCKLISLNPNYEPIDIAEIDDFKCFGKVLN